MSKHSHKHSRRAFLGNVAYGCAGLGASTILSSWTNLGLINAAVAANRPVYSNTNNYKALVCILLSGGNDSYNMLVPKGQDEYAEYASVRTNLALDQNSLLDIFPDNPDGKDYGIHPKLSNIQSLFNVDKDAAFIANIGTLIEPMTLSQYQADRNLPLGLYSHSDQKQQWQTSVPQDRSSNGWGGRLADILQSNNTNQEISMNISLDGLNVFQRGSNVEAYSIQPANNGSILINNYGASVYNTLKTQTVDSLLEHNYINILERAYVNSIKGAKSNSLTFDAQIDLISQSFNHQFGTGTLSQKLEMVAKTIAARNGFAVQNQTFFVELGGFDTHDEIIPQHASLMEELDTALFDFHSCMKTLGLENDVTSFTISDFARKLVTNGDGSDHGWGGHALVVGGAVQGRKIFGQYPDIYIGNPLDTGNGRIIPTTSCDEYFAELALWFGASSSDLNRILPNIDNFWTPTANGHPIGFMNY